MVATYKVKDSTGKTAGFIINDTFYTDDYIKNNINYVDNLVLTENGVIKATKELPEVDYRTYVNEKEYSNMH